MHLYKTYSYLAVWDFENAKKSIQAYLSLSNDEYLHSIGSVNFVSTLIGLGQLDEALYTIEESLLKIQSKSMNRLEGNLRQLKGQALFLKGHHSTALSEIEKASTLVAENLTQDILLIKKWKIIIQSFLNKDEKTLLNFQRNCFMKREWETAREIDRFALRLNKDQKRFDRLWYGTPHICYKNSLANELDMHPSSDSIILGSDQNELYDIKHNLNSGNSIDSPGTKCSILLKSLFSDFYMPIRTAALFSDVYPDEIYDVDSSPVKIRQLQKRLRQWITTNNLPISLSEWNGYYRARPERGNGIVLHSEHQIEQDITEKILKELITNFGFDSEIKPQNACEKLGISRTSFLRNAKILLERNKIKKIGSFNRISYTIPKAS